MPRLIDNEQFGTPKFVPRQKNDDSNQQTTDDEADEVDMTVAHNYSNNRNNVSVRAPKLRAVELPKYDGKSGEAVTWWLEIQEILEEANVDEAQWSLLCKDALSGVALTTWRRRERKMKKERDGAKPTAEELAMVLIKTMDEGLELQLLEYEKKMKMEPLEKPMAFVDRFEELYRKMEVYGYSYTEEQLVMKMTACLRDGMKRRMSLQQPATVDEAATVLQKCYKHDSTPTGSTRARKANSTPKKDLKCVYMDTPGGCYKGDECEYSHESNAKPRSCYRCGSTTHLADTCKEKAKAKLAEVTRVARLAAEREVGDEEVARRARASERPTMRQMCNYVMDKYERRAARH